MFKGFAEDWVETPGARIFVRHGGDGFPIVLLHGHPRTSATWHRVAPTLMDAGFTVICPDLPGYGRSVIAHPASDHSSSSKRAMARSIRSAVETLGHTRFYLVGHDRGSYVALRLALDSPAAVARLALADCVPISEHLARADAAFATARWHWFFYAQPDKPERAIAADPLAWYGFDADTMGAENFAEVAEAVRRPEVIAGMLADYRAGLAIDRQHDEADRDRGKKLTMPVLALWSIRDDLEKLYGDPLAIWRAWADQVQGARIDSGHHMAEEAPTQLTGELERFFG
ncbi:haloacetate dehalogenase [Paramicrobacterium agarici]|uniref:Haloacetate dehalogenase n=1 Tax=Paramicrobacterium agarici TaxID=630514 RepID=A0A2A9DTT8_9MICO|nr:haloacetate dehalogenase [Microbacterium agarici]